MHIMTRMSYKRCIFDVKKIVDNFVDIVVLFWILWISKIVESLVKQKKMSFSINIRCFLWIKLHFT